MPQGYVDSIIHNTGISSCEKCERWQLTLGLLAKMQTVHVLPNAIIYNATINACEKCEQYSCY